MPKDYRVIELPAASELERGGRYYVSEAPDDVVKMYVVGNDGVARLVEGGPPGPQGIPGTPGAFVLIEKRVLAVAGAVTVSNIPQTFTDLFLSVTIPNTGGFEFLTMILNNDTGATQYSGQRMRAQNATLNATTFTRENMLIGAAPAAAGETGIVTVEIFNYAGNARTMAMARFAARTDATNWEMGDAQWLWNDTAAVTSLRLNKGSGNLPVGSVICLYGRG